MSGTPTSQQRKAELQEEKSTMRYRIAATTLAAAVLALTAAPTSAQPFVFDETQCYIDGQSWTGQATWASHGTVSTRIDNGRRYVERTFTYSDGHGGYRTFQWSPMIYGLAEYDGWITVTITTQGRPFADIAWGVAGCVPR